MKKTKEGIIDPVVEIEIQSDRPRRQMAINARNKVKELYDKELA